MLTDKKRAQLNEMKKALLVFPDEMVVFFRCSAIAGEIGWLMDMLDEEWKHRLRLEAELGTTADALLDKDGDRKGERQ